jgi:hypothetical protein
MKTTAQLLNEHPLFALHNRCSIDYAEKQGWLEKRDDATTRVLFPLNRLDKGVVGLVVGPPDTDTELTCVALGDHTDVSVPITTLESPGYTSPKTEDVQQAVILSMLDKYQDELSTRLTDLRRTAKDSRIGQIIIFADAAARLRTTKAATPVWSIHMDIGFIITLTKGATE